MEYSAEIAGQIHLDEFTAIIAEIYAENDRYRSLWDVWCHALHHAAAIGERARKQAPFDELQKEIADFSLWLFTTVHKLTGRLGERSSEFESEQETCIRIRNTCSDLLWHRYPRVCPSCYERRTLNPNAEGAQLLNPCDCLSHRPVLSSKSAKRSAIVALRKFSESRSDKPHGLDEWQMMFATIFNANLRQLSFSDATLHLMEEMGEVSDAIARMYCYRAEDFVAGEPVQRQLRLEAQLADVFSWLFAIVLKAASLQQHKGSVEVAPAGSDSAPLSEIIWNRYGSEEVRSFWCPFCEKTRCECPLIFVPAKRKVTELKSLFQIGEGNEPSTR